MTDAKPSSKVWVFAEQEQGTLADVSLELLSKASELAGRLNTQVGSVLLGSSVQELCAELTAHGADEVFVADDEQLGTYTTLPYSKVIADLAREHEPEIILFGATLVGRDLAPRVASRLRTGLTADCTNLEIGGFTDAKTKKEYQDLLHQIRPAFGGNIIATIVTPEHRPQMATVREGVMVMPARDASRSGAVFTVDVDLGDEQNPVRVIEKFQAEHEVDLKGAKVIVSGGAGAGSKENFELLRELARVLGAEVGASRAAVDGGLIDKAHQVGQTGTTVRPKVYIACGISGAVQHRAGMQEAGKIIAINTDPDAPILKIAHCGIVGDLNAVIPMMIEAYKAKQ